MRFRLVVLWLMLVSGNSAIAQVSIGIGLPSVSIGINLPVYPELVRVPDYPVYYAPRLNSNFFFYDGMYWVYQNDNWYASSWYNGPWGVVGPEVVPLYVLRIPVRYYRNPPGYFRGWRADGPPRWGDHWGHDWQQRRSGWDRWNRNAVPAPAPLPVYQRQYSGGKYPRPEQQQTIHGQNYRYQPRDTVVRQHYQEQAAHRTPAPSQRGQQGGQQDRNSNAQDNQRPGAQQHEQGGPPQHRSQPPQRAGEDAQRSGRPEAPPQQKPPVAQEQRQQPQQSQQAPQSAPQREQQAPRPSQEKAPQGKGPAQEDRREQGGQDKGGQDKGHDKGRDKG